MAGRYRALPFVNEGFPDLLAAADVVVSRAGANTLGELAATATPAVLIPLPRTQSRGEQLANAELFAAQGAALVLAEEQTDSATLTAALHELRCDAVRRGAWQATWRGSLPATPRTASQVSSPPAPAGEGRGSRWW